MKVTLLNIPLTFHCSSRRGNEDLVVSTRDVRVLIMIRK